jgi:hypothetical protein
VHWPSRLRVARGRTAATPWPLLFTHGQGPPERLLGGEDVLLGHRLSLGVRARQLRQHAPHQRLAHPGRTRRQRPLALACRQHAPNQLTRPSAAGHRHQLPRNPVSRTASVHLRRQRLRLFPLLSWRVLVRVPVQEGEAEERRLPQREARQLPPEGMEGPPVVRLSPQVGPAVRLPRHPAQKLLGEAAHLAGEALLVAVVPVQRAHRDARHPRQLLGPHVVVAAPGQKPRRVAHGVGPHLLQYPHAPPPPPRPSRSSPEGTFLPPMPPFLPGGSDMPGLRPGLSPEENRAPGAVTREASPWGAADPPGSRLPSLVPHLAEASIGVPLGSGRRHDGDAPRGKSRLRCATDGPGLALTALHRGTRLAPTRRAHARLRLPSPAASR